MMPVAAVVLAYDENNIKPGWIALVLVLLLALATFLLWRSMNTQLGKIKAPYRSELRGKSELPGHAEGDSEAKPDDDAEPPEGTAPSR